jgi:phage portal protein BeeE
MAELTTRMVSITTPAELERALREGQGTASGQHVNVDSALRVAAVMACVKLRAGAVANMPLGINERVDDRTRRTRTDLPIYQVLNRRPNRWQRPAEFKRMLESHVLLRGNGYALKSKTVRGDVQALIPLNPDRMKVSQLVDSSLSYAYTPKSGGQVVYRQDEIFHLRGFTLDGITGLSLWLSCVSPSVLRWRWNATVPRYSARAPMLQGVQTACWAHPGQRAKGRSAQPTG